MYDLALLTESQVVPHVHSTQAALWWVQANSCSTQNTHWTDGVNAAGTKL